MGAFDRLVHTLADIMEEAGPLCQCRIEAEFAGHHAREEGDLHAVLQHVLSVTRPILHTAEKSENLAMRAMEAHFQERVFARLENLLLQFIPHLFHDLFDPGGVDASVSDQSFERDACHLAPERIECRQDDGLGSVVHDNVDPCCRLEGPDIPSLAPDDAALHLIALDIQYADGRFHRMIGGSPLDRLDNHLLCFAACLVAGLVTDLLQHVRSFRSRLIGKVFHEDSFCVIPGKTGCALQARVLLLHQAVQLSLARIERTPPFIEALSNADLLLLLLPEKFDLPVDILLPDFKGFFLCLELGPLALDVGIEVLLLLVPLVLDLKQFFPLEGICLLLGIRQHLLCHFPGGRHLVLTRLRVQVPTEIEGHAA